MTNVVIGAGSGMGAAVARALAPRGPLVVADRNLEGLEKLVADLGTDVTPVACDITDQAQIDALVGSIDQLDALVCAAGISGSMGTGHQILSVNLVGTARVLAAVEPLLRPGTVGVMFASMSGYTVPTNQALFEVLDDPLDPRLFEKIDELGINSDSPQFAYPSSKRAIHLMARRLAAPWGAKGARILSLSPGINDTPMNHLDESRHPIMQEFIEGSPLGRRGRPEEVANVVAFLTSEAASFMTGSDVLVDGGMVGVIPKDGTGGNVKPD